MTDTRIISADCHICEPPHVFDNVPAAFKDRTPKMMRGLDGGDGWSFDGGPPKRTFGIEATAGQAAGNLKISGLRFDEIMPGNYDGRAHVADMDQDGVDVSVVYPASAIFTYIEPDRDLAVACMRSYNDGVLDELGGAAPGRIVGLPMLPVDDGMDVCIAEFERCLATPRRACRSRSTAPSAASRRTPTGTSWSTRRSPRQAPSIASSPPSSRSRTW